MALWIQASKNELHRNESSPMGIVWDLPKAVDVLEQAGPNLGSPLTAYNLKNMQQKSSSMSLEKKMFLWATLKATLKSDLHCWIIVGKGF
jgi:hypothetical protein